ncbi:chemotaxis protein CheB [Sphingobacterium alkalisoli]|uniref:protein-glutamate methylesterase n=1 Tax=Sphingobacterium alkalisoli TaxID=1874115 RepID=A0A4U0GWD9_9SPHI|nr:chemotaxis protein CheB [Sphingobacterium alkalisoli]TJY63435.1 chemotaxis protein CheB [Sphingobacterium alkalisoli]GGH26046.1 putative chemotaxis protein-glutamate methylesterase [Sphingobacterium alkalisoli]
MVQDTKIFLIGGSAGSLTVLLEVLPQLRNDILFPIVIILHRKSHPDSILNMLLSNYTNLEVCEAEDKMMLKSKCIYLVPPDYHLLFEDTQMVSLDSSEKINYSRPSIDVTLQSAAEVFKENAVALLLSGANADGVDGLQHIKRNNGKALAQEPETAAVNYMPRQAILQVDIDRILRPDQMAEFINNL